jgi:hypothetical protein
LRVGEDRREERGITTLNSLLLPPLFSDSLRLSLCATRAAPPPPLRLSVSTETPPNPRAHDGLTPGGALTRTQIAELATRCPALLSTCTSELDPASWVSVAWYPIYRIPMGRSLRDLHACFLTFHALVPPDQPGAQSSLSLFALLPSLSLLSPLLSLSLFALLSSRSHLLSSLSALSPPLFALSCGCLAAHPAGKQLGGGISTYRNPSSALAHALALSSTSRVSSHSLSLRSPLFLSPLSPLFSLSSPRFALLSSSLLSLSSRSRLLSSSLLSRISSLSHLLSSLSCLSQADSVVSCAGAQRACLRRRGRRVRRPHREATPLRPSWRHAWQQQQQQQQQRVERGAAWRRSARSGSRRTRCARRCGRAKTKPPPRRTRRCTTRYESAALV